MVSTETYINFIIENLRKGVVNYSDNVSAFCSKFQLTERTFATYWKKANQIYIDEVRRIEKEKTAIATQQAIKSTERNILTKYEALEILAQIAKGEKRDYEEQGVIIPSDSERKAAIETISKIEGWFVPEKTEHTVNIPLIEWVKNEDQ